MFAFTTQNWRGKPLVTVEAIVELIGHTKTKTGLIVRAAIDAGTYPSGIKVSNEQLSEVKLRLHKFHGEWNYTIRPNT